MEPLSDTDPHRDESPVEDNPLPLVFPVLKIDFRNDEAAAEAKVQTVIVTDLVSDKDANDEVPTLGSPFCSPKPKVKDVQNDMSFKDDQNDVSLGETHNDMSLQTSQSDTSLEDSDQVASPTNGDATKKTPIAVRPSANPQGIPAVSDSSADSLETLVPTPEVHQKLTTNVTAITTIKQDINQDTANAMKEDIDKDIHVVTSEDIDQDPTIIIKEDVVTNVVTANPEHDATIVQDGANSSEDDTETVTQSIPPAKLNHGVPPHMRADFHPPLARQYGVRETRQTMPIPEGPRILEVQRPSRRENYGYGMQGYRNDIDREQVARLSAQLMKTQNELNAERKRAVNLRTTIEAEQQVKTEAALSTMLNDLLQKQIETFTQAVKNDALVRDIQFREQKATQLEVFLAEGQKQFVYELDDRGLRPLSSIEREHIKRSTELALKKNIAKTDAKLTAQLEGLRLRESMQLMREQQYKALIRSSLEQELKLSASQKSLAPEKAAEIAELEYNRGFGVGKAAARREVQEEVRKKGWCEGYAACHRALSAIADLRAGRVEVGSPELEFLWDVGHEGNLFGVGVRVGEMQQGVEKETEKGKVKVAQKVAPKAKAPEEIEEAPVEVNEDAEEEQEQTVHPPAAKKPATPPAPAPPTFASQLRGKQAMHNGHVVLAGCSEKQKEDLIDLMG